MPIRIRGSTAARIGRVAAQLASAASSVRGTVVAPPNRDGRLVVNLGSAGASLRGQFAVAANRNGRVSTALSPATSAVRGTFSSDVTAPTAPTITATQTGSSSISVALTAASTDAGGSGVASYAVEYKRHVDSTYTVAASAVTAGQFPYSITGLVAATLYDVRARAKDVAGNVGAYSAVSQATTTGAASLSLEQDWTNRISDPGVVWYHNFENPDEVNNFRFQGGIGTVKDINGSDGACRWQPGSGAFGLGAGFMEINIPTGGQAASGWFRPMSPLTGSGNGRGANDPGANGTISAKTYDPTNVNAYAWAQGYYGHSDYQTSAYDGAAFYIQYRVRLTSGRGNVGNPPGKLTYIDTPNGGAQELVTNSQSGRVFQMYSNFGAVDGALWDPQGDRNSYTPTPFPVTYRQPGVGRTGCTYEDSSCSIDGNPPACWCMPLDEWFTVQVKITPGHMPHDSYPNLYNSAITTNKDTRIEVWVARYGATSYTKIFDKSDFMVAYGGGGTGSEVQGWNMFKCSGYMNNVNSVEGWQQQFAQIIFSKNPIPCPQAYNAAPAWFTAMADKTWATPVTNTINAVRPAVDPPGGTGLGAVTTAWTGACVDQRQGEYILPAQGGHNDYYGNEIYAVALRQTSPAWVRIQGPTSNAQLKTDNPGANPPNTSNLDGSPRSIHGWFQPQCSRDGRIWLVGGGGYANPNGDWAGTVYSIDRNNLGAGWVYHGRLFTSFSGSFGFQSGAGAYDPTGGAKGKFLRACDFADNNGVFKVDVAAAVAAGAVSQTTGPAIAGLTTLPWSVTGGNAGSNPWSCALHNLKRRAWLIGSTETSHLFLVDIDNPTSFVQVTATGTGGFAVGSNAVYHAPSRSVLVYGTEYGSASIRKLTITGNDPFTATYAWTTVAPAAGNTITPSAPSGYAGTFSKLQLIEDMGNGQSALVLVTNVNGPVFVYKIPRGEFT